MAFLMPCPRQMMVSGNWSTRSPLILGLTNCTMNTTFLGRYTTIAVLDSGIHFDKKAKNVLGTKLDKLFHGQADFVGDGTCTTEKGLQYTNYCFSEKGEDSYDGFGHGSHVAGIIWNNFTDLNTGVYAGVAPEAEILSVRVLGTDGTGSYADVIEGIQYVVANKDTYNVKVMNLSLSAYATTPYFADPDEPGRRGRLGRGNCGAGCRRQHRLRCGKHHRAGE